MDSLVGEGKVGRANHNKTLFSSWGANSYGQLAQGHTEDELLPREITPIKVEVKSVCGGGGHTLIIDVHGGLWTCGSNNKGQLGIGNTGDVPTLTQVAALRDTPVSVAAGGWDFTLVLTASGDVYSMGSNKFGQLGGSELPDIQTTPAKISVCEDDGVKCVAAGLRHSVAVTDSGRVFTWGSGKKGQLGVVHDGKCPAEVLSSVEVPYSDGNGKVIHAVAGEYHTALLTDSGGIIMFGENKYGQCGVDPSQRPLVPTPQRLDPQLFNNESVKDLKSGWSHLLASTVSGAVYSWGRCDYGQLGRQTETAACDHIPRKVEGLQNPKHVVCGSTHNMAITAEEGLVTWGWNEHGMCATGDEVNVAFPHKVAALSTLNVTTIGCGAGHCFVLTQQEVT